MVIIEKDSELNINLNIFKQYEMDSIVYFDIETTGFDKVEDIIMLISIGWFTDKNSFHIKQYYADDISEEGEILREFNSDIVKFDAWCSYNGRAFDEPFIVRRMTKNFLSFNPPVKHIDLYRLIRPYYKQLGMTRCNLKSVEHYVGIQREDKIDGGVSVQLYYKYLENKDEAIRSVIMLHNFEDVLNLPRLFKVVYQIDNESGIVREDCITDKQLKYLKFLLSKKNFNLDFVIEKISKKTASKIIDSILKGDPKEEDLKQIVGENN